MIRGPTQVKVWNGSAILLVVAIVGLALVVRVSGLEAQSLTHPESYVPRIDFPGYVTSPMERQTLAQVLWGTLRQDVHPPAYYVLMWIWTGIFGTGLFAMRLPSALAGAATVLLLYRLSRPIDGPRVALMASALLALNGHHILWSQQARMWVPVTLIAVASTVVLSRLVRTWSSGYACSYVALLTLGLWTEYYFWPFFFAQLLWTAGSSLGRARLPAPLMLQTVSLILATPVLMLVRLHSQVDSYLQDDFGAVFVDLVGFSRALDSAAMVQRFSWLGFALAGLLAATGTVLIAVGARARANDAIADAPPHPPDRYPSGFLAAPIVAALAVTALDLLAGDFFSGESPKLLAAGVVLPWIIVTVWWVTGVSGLGVRVHAALQKIPGVRFLLADVVVVQAIVPVAVLFAASILTPLLVARGLLMFAPFWLLLTARGMSGWLTSPARITLAWSGVIALGLCSGYQYAGAYTSARDYQSLAVAMRPLMQSGDVVVVENNWWSQPLHYYLPPTEVRTVGSIDAAVASPDAESERIWVVAFQGDAPSLAAALAEPTRTLDDYVELERVSARRIVAGLFQRR